jgi:serine/threonine protein kinase
MSPLGPSSPGAALPPGTLLGAFEILSVLGRGGMGAVYRARNRVTGDVRALKLILPELAANPEFVERFIREIRLAMAVEHPNMVRVFEPGMDGERMFLPMELLVGESLAERLHREPFLPVDTAIGLLQTVGSALMSLHAKGILHRDVKPSNVFLAQEGRLIVPKLLDLGAGKQVGMTDEATATGGMIGSPHYMAPEQASGRKDLDPRADQYALGVVAYQLFTGALPYENDDTGHVLSKLLSGAPFQTPRQRRPDISEGVEVAVLKAMSRAREDRFPSVVAFVSTLAIRSYAPPPLPPEMGPAGEGSGTMNAAVVSPPVASGSRARIWAAVTGVFLLGLLLTVAILKLVASTSAGPSAASSTPIPPATAPSTLPSSTAPQEPVAVPPATAAAADAPPDAATPSGATAAPYRAPPKTPRGPGRPGMSAKEPCKATIGAPCL